jgi:general secretion pathway protein E
VNSPDRLAALEQADFSAWDLARALRHRVLVLRPGPGQGATLLAGAAPEPLLVQAVQTRLREPLALRIDADELAARLAEAERDFRALDHDAGLAAGSAEPGPDGTLHELSSRAIAEQGSAAVRLLDAVLHDALQDGASDVHIECDARGAAVRLRIDGVMQMRRRLDTPALAEQLVSRLKVMAELDIGERRLPQDGRFRLRLAAGSAGLANLAGREIDFRLSIMPTLHGEDAVVRVLDRATLDQGQGLTLAALGFEPALRERLLQLARLPHGLLLVTGPTGSGKTTTLYAALAETHSAEEKLVTIEDPVEYRLAGVVQIPVNEKKGLGFARGLRSILRHDPDRVMVGEIRDAETAQIAVQAALTGHLVFSSVHANHALDVIGRFLHMGLDAYQVVGALEAVLAQRLLRVRCSACGGKGCALCHGSGWRGRRAIAELLRLDDEVRDMLVARAPLVQLKQALARRGHQTLRDAALAALAAGWTSAEEVARVTADV